MADTSSRDQNYRTSLLAVSSVDGTSTVTLYADPVSHRLLTQADSVSGSGAPLSTPSRVGQQYVDTVGLKIYIATGTASSSDWTVIN